MGTDTVILTVFLTISHAATLDLNPTQEGHADLPGLIRTVPVTTVQLQLRKLCA